MTDLVKLYNPASAASLTPDQLQALQTLTNDQIRELAQAYPNATMQQAYLLIIDSQKPISKQIPNLSTFESLWNLRTKNGQKQYVAFNFKANYKPTNIKVVTPKRIEVRDLSDTELMSLPGFKTKNESFPPKTVEITNIKKVPIGDANTTSIIPQINVTTKQTPQTLT